MSIGEKVYLFYPSQIVLIPPNIPHKKSAKEGFCDISIMAKEMRPIGDAMPKLFEDMEGHLRQLFDLMVYFGKSKEQVSNERRIVILNSLGESIYQILGSMYVDGKRNDLRIEKFIERMEAGVYSLSYDLSEEIDKLGYSKGYFRKVFKEAMHESPVSYFNKLRIARAKREFDSYGSSRSVKEVALACGFDDVYYFSRLFKKVEGISPSAYIKQIGSFDLKQVHK